MKRVTVQDIADALSVSRNTVSRDINNTDGLADATREKILQKAVEMGYKQFSYMAALSGNSASVPATLPLRLPERSPYLSASLFCKPTTLPSPCSTDFSRKPLNSAIH